VWLSEGFATWLSEKIMDTEQIPERAHLAAINSRERSMRVDASARTRPVRLEVRDRARSRDIYNRLVYEKGASVLLMLEGWLGEQPVQEAARAYLKEQRFGNATTADFMAALARASGTDPTAVTHALLDKTGIPHISVRLKCGGPGSEEKPRVEIRQSGPGPVPVCWRAAGGVRQCTVMDTQSRDVPLASCAAWIYPNAGGVGYYRTAWTAAELDTLPLDDLTPAERLTLAYDLRAQKTDREAARAMLAKLAGDHTTEVANAAKAALK
jgi:aminopeptidase N